MLAGLRRVGIAARGRQPHPERLKLAQECRGKRQTLGDLEPPVLEGYRQASHQLKARAVTNNSKQKPEYGTVAEAGDEGSGDFTFILRQPKG